MEKSVWVSSSETGPRSLLRGWGGGGGVRSKAVRVRKRMGCEWGGDGSREGKGL